jgi:uncharacterized Ntn-hydrolase superfamily protein
MTKRYVVIPGDPDERAFAIAMTGPGMVVDTTTPEIGYGFGALATQAAEGFEDGSLEISDYLSLPLTDVERKQLATALAGEAA